MFRKSSPSGLCKVFVSVNYKSDARGENDLAYKFKLFKMQYGGINLRNMTLYNSITRFSALKI